METNLQEIISEQTKILADFRQYLLDDGKATRTVQSYVTDVSHFVSYINDANPKRLSELTRQCSGRKRPSKLVFGGLLFLPRGLVLPAICRIIFEE